MSKRLLGGNGQKLQLSKSFQLHLRHNFLKIHFQPAIRHLWSVVKPVTWTQRARKRKGSIRFSRGHRGKCCFQGVFTPSSTARVPNYLHSTTSTLPLEEQGPFTLIDNYCLDWRMMRSISMITWSTAKEELFEIRMFHSLQNFMHANLRES